MGLGILNPCGFQCGGGPTLTEKVYRQLRQGLGTDGAGPEDGLEDRWRQCKALVIAKAMDVSERAAMQAFPQLGVEHAPVYEAVLSLPAQPTLAEETDAIASSYTLELDATIAGLQDELSAIDAAIVIDLIASGQSVVTRHGKPFQVDGAPQGTSQWPAYSQHFFLHVRWPVTGGVPPADKKRLVERALSRSLPSWVDWTIYNQAGFYLDGFNDSYLDVTAMGG
jgi:hypothetical protein